MDNSLRIIELKKQIFAKEQRITSLTAEINAGAGATQQKHSEIASIKREGARLSEEAKKEEEKIQKLEAFLRMYTKARSIFENDIQKRKKNFLVVNGFISVVALAKQYASYMNDYMNGSKHTKAISNLDRIQSSTDKEIKATDKKIKSLHDEIKVIERRYSEVKAELSRLMHDLGQKRTELISLKNEVARLQHELSTLV
jgi:chromosome segregation ATPase